MFIALGGLSPIWEAFITTIININTIPTFDELLGKCIQEEAKIIFRGIISHHRGEPIAFTTNDKRKICNKNKFSFKSNKGNLDMSKDRCSNCQMHGRFSRDCKERRK